MAKIESGKLELHETLHRGDKGGNSLLEVFGAEAARKGIDFHTEYDVQDKYFWIDENRANQIVANIISNAIKYTEPGGDIWYKVKQVPDKRPGYGKYTVSVEDNGHGMSSEFLEKVFDAFERDSSAI
jgi:Signal transduction histidine kinase